jgi:hypothetical protein
MEANMARESSLRLGDRVSEVKQRMADEGIVHPIIARLADESSEPRRSALPSRRRLRQQ